MKTVAFHTLGCKLNFSESSTIARDFTNNGFDKVDFNAFADVYVINTCSVTEHTNKKCRDIIKKAYKLNPKAIIAVIGCYSQLKPEEIVKMEGVDLVLGSNEKFKLFEYIQNYDANKNTADDYHSHIFTDGLVKDNFNSSYSVGDRTRSFLKIQDGCDYKCSYCTIPLARGNSRSDTLTNVIEKAKEIASNNVKEIILTGVNTGDFGRKTNESFLELLKQLDLVDGIERYRISSIEPNLLTDEILDFVVSSKKFMPHFHIPLQSGSDNILKLMKRRYNTDLFSNLIQKINNKIDDCFIGIDVIVGFPGETEIDFQTTYNFIEQLNISFLHVFTYSERENTDANEMKDIVPNRIRKERSIQLHNLSTIKQRDFYLKNQNKIRPALFEGTKNKGFMYGFTDNYIKIKTIYIKELTNTIASITLNKLDEDGCFIV